jgi:hypothetical protein
MPWWGIVTILVAVAAIGLFWTLALLRAAARADREADRETDDARLRPRGFMSDEPEIREPTFEELIESIREPLAELEAIEHVLQPAAREFVRDMRRALDDYDREAS